MSRISGRVLWTVATMAMVVAMAQVAEAQREGGRRGGGRGMFGRGFGISPVQLAAESEEVQAALKLTDDQKTKIGAINDELSEARRDLFQGGGGGREERQKLDADAAAKLAEVLDDSQKKRLMGIQIQVNGANSLLDAAVAKELKISEDQNEELSDVRDSNQEAAGEAMRDLRDQELSREEMMAKFQEIRAEGDKKLLAVLTSEQQAQYEALKGEPVEVDMSQFRGGFGGGRGRGGVGGGRGRRNRDNDTDTDQGV
jgi:hypothetical protein